MKMSDLADEAKATRNRDNRHTPVLRKGAG